MMIGLDRLAALDVPGPTRTAVSEPFWAAIDQGQFVLQRCRLCGDWVFYPRALCPHCWSDELDWQPAIGKGILKTFSVVHRAGHPGWQPATPYAVGLVALAESPTMLSHILVPPEELSVGMPLKLRITRIGAVLLPCFEADR